MSGPLDIFGPDPLDAFGPASEDEAEEERLRRERLRVWRERLEASRDAPQFEKPGYSGAFADKIGNTVRSGAYDMFDLGVNKVLSPLAISGARARSRSLGAPQFLEEDIERARELDRESRQRLADASVDLPTPIAAAGFWAAEAAGMALDPLEALPGGLIARGATKAGRAARSALARGGRGVAEEALPGLARSVDIEDLTRSIDPPEVPSHAGQAGESPEAISRVSRGEKYYRVKPSGEVQPILNTVDAVDVKLNPGEAKVRVSADGRLDIEDAGRGTKPQVDAMERLREGERPAVPRETEEGGEYFLDLDAEEPELKTLKPPETPYQYSTDLPKRDIPEVKELMESEEVLARRRTGHRASSVLQELEQSTGKTMDDFIDAPPGSIWNDEESLQLRQYIHRLDREADQISRRVASGEAVPADTDRLFEARGKKIDLIMADMAGASEQGRALQSRQRVLREVETPEDLRSYLAYKLGDRVKKGDVDPKDMELLARTDVTNPDELIPLLQKIQQPKWHDHPIQMFMSNILTSIGSFSRAAVGNSLMWAARIPVRGIAGMVDAPLSKLTGRTRQRYVQETLPMIWSVKEGLQDGLKRMKTILTREWFSDPIRLQAEAISKDPSIAPRLFDEVLSGGEEALSSRPGEVIPRSKVFSGGLPAMRRAKSPFVRKYVAPVYETGFRGHGAIDQLARGVNEQSELRVLALRSGLQKGLDGDDLQKHISDFLSDPEPAVIERVAKYGELQTFQLPLGEIGKAVQNLVSKVPPLRLVQPFIKTAGNIFKESAKFTPLNLITGGGKSVLAPRVPMMLKEGAEEATEELAKVAIGTTVMTWGFFKAMSGELVGPAPKDQAERDAFYELGKKPFSVRSGGEWTSFSQMEPFGMPLSLIASGYEGVKNSEPDANASEKFIAAMSLMMASQFDKSYFAGLADLADLTDVRPGDAPSSGLLMRQVAATAVPQYSMMRSVAGLTDPRVPAGEAPIFDKESGVDYILEAIPGLTKKVPIRKTRFGEDVTKSWWEAIGPTGTFLVPSKVTTDEVELALEELGLRVGFPGKSIEGVDLDRNEYRAFLERVGPRTKDVLRTLLLHEGFRSMDRQSQQDLVDTFVGSKKNLARLEAMFGLIPKVSKLDAKKGLAQSVRGFDMSRSGVDGISSDYNEKTRNRGRVGLGDMVEASQEAEARWSQSYSAMQQAVKDAGRRGLSQKEVFSLLKRQGLSDRLARSLVRGEEMSYADYQRGRD